MGDESEALSKNNERIELMLQSHFTENAHAHTIDLRIVRQLL
jgi:hypothetical protein